LQGTVPLARKGLPRGFNILLSAWILRFLETSADRNPPLLEVKDDNDEICSIGLPHNDGG